MGNANPEVTQMLIKAGSDIEAKDERGMRPLHEAAFFNENPAVIKTLVAAGADLEARDVDGYTPLHAAACGGDFRRRARRNRCTD